MVWGWSGNGRGVFGMNRLALGAVMCMPVLFVAVAAPSAEAATERVVYSFCSQAGCVDGKGPYAGLLAVKGVLFGTTSEGGTGRCRHGCGAVFSIDPETGAEAVLHSFDRNGTDGLFPLAAPFSFKNKLYGTTRYGGNGSCTQNYVGCGAVFSLDARSGAETVLYSFQNSGTDGSEPWAALIAFKGSLYGSTSSGGSEGYGTVFQLDRNTGAETVVHSFQYSDGANPLDRLIDVNGMLYGTANRGGAYGYGVVFAVDPSAGTETVVHSFQHNGADGTFPQAGLIAVNGMLYGMTYAGGQNDGGTIFSLDPNTGAVTVLYSFAGGAYPVSHLVGANGMLFGTTPSGGIHELGTVFSFDPATGIENDLHTFGNNGTDGYYPEGNLVRVGRTLYGTTDYGGAHDGGTVFSIAHWH
jgi:uncharacterized repeat protein (TIGR03803 family)